LEKFQNFGSSFEDLFPPPPQSLIAKLGTRYDAEYCESESICLAKAEISRNLGHEHSMITDEMAGDDSEQSEADSSFFTVSRRPFPKECSDMQ
jgi:hypothetical protein